MVTQDTRRIFTKIKNKLEKYIYKDFILYDILDTYYICEQYNTYISKSIKYCNDLWYVLDFKTNLWKNVKEVQPYFLKILRIGLLLSKNQVCPIKKLKKIPNSITNSIPFTFEFLFLNF